VFWVGRNGYYFGVGVRRNEGFLSSFKQLITHGSLIFWSNPPAKPNAIVEYSPILRDQTGLCVGFAGN